MWNKPWKYREGFAISIGLLITGALLQVSIGLWNGWYLCGQLILLPLQYLLLC